MCYMLLLSTDSPEDLSANNDSHIAFSRELPGLPEETMLTYPHKWFVGSRHGCSCGFRHLYVGSVELGFGEPVDWYEEENEDIEATLRFVRIINGLLQSGAGVECIDAWRYEDKPPQLSGTIEVDLSEITDRAFRFYENHRFVFRIGT